MKPVMEPYTYFQPGDVIFLINGARASALPASSTGAGSNQEPGSSPAGAENTVSGDLQPDSLEINPPARKPVYEGVGDPSFDDKVKVLMDWSRSIAEGLGLDVTIEANRNRDVYFPGVSGGLGLVAKTTHLETEKLSGETAAAGESVSAPERGYTSPIVSPPGAFSLVVAEVKQNVQSLKDNPERYVPHKDLAALIAALDDQRSAQELKSNGIELGVVLPNWLAGPASEWGGGGGPGSRPVPYKGDPGSARYKFQFSKELESLCSANKDRWGAGVKVVILDTAPSMHDLVWAYERYHKVNPAKQREHHPLIESLLRPGGMFHVHHASREDLFRMRAVHLRDHNYNMTAHGLFVAGIIHSIAPAAEIHLYEVLNSEGVGDLTTIYNALAKVAEEFKGQQYVVNCSLTLTVPFNGNPDSPDSASRIGSANSRPISGHRLTDMYPAFLDKIRKDPFWIMRTCSWIQSACDAIYYSNSRVIAAAGNDWVRPTGPGDPGRPQARAIASFESVQGVGAIPRDQPATAAMPGGRYEASSYSDLSDQPSGEGIVTLGGEPGEGKGILGVYVGEFPVPAKFSFWQLVVGFITKLLGDHYTGAPENKNDWAWWAGTSFAAPVLTGCIAAVLSNSPRGTSTEDAIQKMRRCDAIQDDRTSHEEDLLAVTQNVEVA